MYILSFITRINTQDKLLRDKHEIDPFVVIIISQNLQNTYQFPKA